MKVWEKIIVINERERVGEHGEKEKKSEKTGWVSEWVSEKDWKDSVSKWEWVKRLSRVRLSRERESVKEEDCQERECEKWFSRESVKEEKVKKNIERERLWEE